MKRDIELIKDKLYKKDISEIEWYYILEFLPELPDDLRKVAVATFLKEKKNFITRLEVMLCSPNPEVRRVAIKIVERLPFEVSIRFIKKGLDDYDINVKKETQRALGSIIEKELLDAKTLGTSESIYEVIFNKILQNFSVEYITFYEQLLALLIRIGLKRLNLREKLVDFIKRTYVDKYIDENFIYNALKLLSREEQILFIRVLLEWELKFCYPIVKRYIENIRASHDLETIFLSTPYEEYEIFSLLRNRLKENESNYIAALSSGEKEEEMVYYIKLLSRLATKKAYETLIQFKDAPSKLIRIAFINGLKYFDKFDIVPILKDIINSSKDVDIILAAMQTLADINFEAFRDIAPRVVLSDNSLVRAFALSLIEKYSKKSKVRLLELLYPRISNKNMAKMLQSHPNFLNMVLDEAYSSDSNIRKIVLQIINMSIDELDKKRVFEHIKDMIYDTDEYIRSQATKILAKLNISEAYNLLFKTLNDPDKRVQANAIEALFGAVNKDVVKEKIEKFLSSDDNRLRANAAVFFAKAGDDKGKQVLREMLKNKNYLMRASGVWGLGEVGSLEDIDYLEQLREKEEKDIVLRNIDKSIEKIKKRVEEGP